MSKLVSRWPLEFRRSVSYLVLTVAICFFHLGVFFGLDFSDSFYHLNQAVNPVDDKYLYPFLLSSAIIKNIIEVVGHEVIYLRLINSVLLFLSFLLPYFLIGKAGPKKKTQLIFILSLIVFTPFTVNILGYDTLSIFILSLIFSISVLYGRNQRWYLVILLALLCSMAVLIRLPNLLVIPILCLFFFFATRRNSLSSRLGITAAFGLLAILGICIGFFSYYGDYYSFQEASANTNSHFVKQLLANYIRDGITVFFFTVFLLGIYFLFTIVEKKVPRVTAFTMFSVIFLGFLGIFITPSKYAVDYALFVLALALAFTLLSLYHNWSSFKNRQILILYLLFLFINPFGSNTGLLKGYSLFVLFPFVYESVRYKSRNFWIYVFLLLVPLAILTKIYGVYEDKNMFSLKAIPNHELLTSIRTNNVRADYLNHIIAKIDEYQEEGYNVFVYGDKSHIFNYLFPETSIGVASFFQPIEDLTFLPNILSRISSGQKTVIFLVPSYPAKSNAEMTGSLERELLKAGFIRVEDNLALIYQSPGIKRKNSE